MNIPARYCTGYLSDIGVPPPHGPMDFAAWFEAYIGGRWHTFDRAEQHPADRPRAHRPWTRRDGCGDQQHVRSQHARGLHGLGGRGHESARPHAPSDRTARHDLPLFGTGEIWRASHDVPAARESRSPARQHEAGYPAAPVGPSLASRCLRQFGGDRHLRRARRPSCVSTARSPSSTSRRRCPTMRSRSRRAPIRFTIRMTNGPISSAPWRANIRATTSVRGRRAS